MKKLFVIPFTKMYRLYRRNLNNPTTIKSPYLVFNPHSENPCIMNPNEPFIYITTIDPGTVNCCIRCSEYNKQTNKSRTLTQVLVDFKYEDNAFEFGNDMSYYNSIFKLLDPFEEYFINSHYIGIESQLRDSYDNIRISQHLITYLMCTVKNKGRRPYILELDSHLKTRLLNAPKCKTKYQRKKWAKEKGIELLIQMGESNVADELKKGKMDDHGDVICYEQVIILLLRGILNPPTGNQI